MNKKVTTEDLTAMIADGFAGVDKRFDAVGARLDRIEKVILAEHERSIERIEEALAIPMR